MLIEDIKDCLRVINKFGDQYHINYCFSRRTPKNIKKYIIDNKHNSHDYFPKGELNPYSELLESSTYFIITQDSVGMISDALNTGKSIYIIKLKNIKKIKRFQ